MGKADARSLKRQNRLPLAALLICDCIVFVILTRGAVILEGIRARSLEGLPNLLPASVVFLVVSLLTHQLSPSTKARIVFMRWLNPLPGTRAFSVYALQDSRVDVAKLDQQFGPLPTSPKEQNVLWYRLYRTLEGKPSVRDAHQQYLLWRDCTVITVLLVLGMVPMAAFLTRKSLPVLELLVLLAVQFLLSVRAARVNGARLVTNVLALASSQTVVHQ
jgi:hypothetical protein